jgi:glycosyltransferase involved in cell wall biosynthesis
MFSIGITTYNRRAHLKECLESILRQDFGDFEVLVGNDYVEEPITLEEVGISDSRVRVINHPRNLGELNNMNFLLEAARGRYFSWLADDDAYFPGFLRAASVLEEEKGECFFSEYAEGPALIETPPTVVARSQTLSGKEFLFQYLRRKIRVIGCYGFFEITCLRALGGMRQLGSGFSPYSDNLLVLLAAGSCERVLFRPVPLVFFRVHAESLSNSSCDQEAFISAQLDFLARSRDIFTSWLTQREARKAMAHLLRWCAGDFTALLLRARNARPGPLLSFRRATKRYEPLAVGERLSYGYFWTKLLLRLLAKSFILRTAPRSNP